MENKKEISLLTKVTTNHLFLTQFEAFRASLLTLHKRGNPKLALSILQTVVSLGGKINNLVFSDSSSSPALLTWLSSLLLLEFNNNNDNESVIWNLDSDLFKLKVEFLLFIQLVVSRVECRVDLDSLGKEDVESDFECRVEDLVDLKGKECEFVDFVSVLDKVSELGLRRLRRDIIVQSGDGLEEEFVGIGDEEIKCLMKLFLEQSDVFDALCFNIQKQVGFFDGEESGLAITVHVEEKRRVEVEEEVRILKLIQRNVQLAHLDALKELVKENDVEGAVSHIRFLHLDYGVLETEYRMALQDLTKKIWLARDGFGDTWIIVREQMMSIYGEALSSNCTQLVQMIQVIQDEMINEEIQMFRDSDANWIPPLERLQHYFIEVGRAMNLESGNSYLRNAFNSCRREMYHYARVSGVHMFDSVMDGALAAVKREQFEEASNVCAWVYDKFDLANP